MWLAKEYGSRKSHNSDTVVHGGKTGMEVLGGAMLGLRPICLCYLLIFPTRSGLATAFNTTSAE